MSRLVLVAGVGRSGTSLMTGILGQVGFHIPQPEIGADETNPKGFGEPAWVVNFHQRVMRRRRVTVFDARPHAWEVTDAVADDAEVRSELRAWLKGELAQADAVVVKDPRVGWFLPLWTGCASDVGAPAAFVCMLRHPAEILASARKWYGDWQTDASRAAAWINVMLETERKTREMPRAFVRYEDLLADWERELRRTGEAIDDPILSGMDRSRFPAVDEFVDPTLHRNRRGWEGLEVPDSVRELADRVWFELQPLANTGGDGHGVRTVLDASHDEYKALYGEAEAISQSSVTAVKPRKKAGGGPPPSLRVRVARRIPPGARKQLRRLVGRSGSG
ncbi:MAG TPA: sulfotransferase [Thermoleophilaceae bacterium]